MSSIRLAVSANGNPDVRRDEIAHKFHIIWLCSKTPVVILQLPKGVADWGPSTGRKFLKRPLSSFDFENGEIQRMNRLISAFVIASVFAAGTTALGAVIPVTSLQPTIVLNGGWGQEPVLGGTAAIVDLTGVGGNLENNQPLPVGAVRLTTGANNGDKIEVGISQDFGDAFTVLNNLLTGFAYYKDASGNLTAAPSLKLSVFAPGGTGDNFGQLIFEPGWNQGNGGSGNPPTGDWQTVAIDSNTGSGIIASGGWWWSGGFGQASGAGGPPIRSAAEWAALFTTSDPTDFANARITEIRVGVGTFNQNQLGYFDQVVFGDTIWNFEPAASGAVPEPASLALWGFGTLGLAFFGRRRRRAAITV